jgi:hypothetical protein
MYFKKKTYEEFTADPLGVEYKRRKVNNDPSVRDNVIKVGLLKAKIDAE